METGRVISRRYLLQRLIKQGQICTIYQGVDQLLQRAVAVKSVPATQMPAFKAAIRMTAQFSHPNIVGLYDLITEPESLYLVQEYVEGEDFATLLQVPLSPVDVADFGCQMCQALIYGASSARKICHGDLTPAAILRDRRGVIRVNNFALPGDLHYFTTWSKVGGEGVAVSDRELPWGLPSEGRYADDTRAVGLLLYQLLAGRPAGTTTVEPPADGRLRFMRNVPVELCQVVARAVVRQHPEHINTVEALYTELKTLTETLEPNIPMLVNSPAYQQAEVVKPRQFTPVVSGNPGSALPIRESGQAGLTAYRAEKSAKLSEMEPAPPTVADVSLNLVAARQAAYPHKEAQPGVQRSSVAVFLVLVLIGLLAFALFFLIGYLAGHFIFPVQ